MAISKEQVWAAADELDANGQKPTLAAVRKAIGGDGADIRTFESEHGERDQHREEGSV